MEGALGRLGGLVGTFDGTTLALGELLGWVEGALLRFGGSLGTPDGSALTLGELLG